MRTSFRDTQIMGTLRKGVNTLDHAFWEDEEKKTEANQHCESIIYVACSPDLEIPNRVCVAYMRGAIKAGFDIMFAYGGGPMGIFNIGKLDTKFG